MFFVTLALLSCACHNYNMVKFSSKIRFILRHEGLIRHLVKKKELKRLYQESPTLGNHDFMVFEYKIFFGKEPDLINPTTYNEKLLWEKLYWRNPVCNQCADKFRVRSFVASRGCGDYLNQLYYVGANTSRIDLSTLPKSFVIKSTHGCGGVRVVKNRDNAEEVEKSFSFIDNTLKSQYDFEREWVYENKHPQVIVEKYLETLDGHSPKDYKFFCFWGEPYCLYVGSNRDSDLRFDFYNLKWEKIDVENGYLNSGRNIKRPEKLDEMIALAKKLSKGFPHVRIDMYYENNSIIFGEMTFFHQAGCFPFYPNDLDIEMGKRMDLSRISSDEIRI